MTLLGAERVYDGRVMNLDVDTVRFPDGSTGRLEMIRHPGASAVVPFLDPTTAPDPRILLLRQFRHAADGYLWEVPAGRLDAGEDPEACARRELREEAGRDATFVERLCTIYTTPGFTDEVIHLFAAQGLVERATAREADEFIEVHAKRWSEVLGMISQGEIQDGKTLVALLFVQCFRKNT
jgi:ADP-ribose pyrophosphatase